MLLNRTYEIVALITFIYSIYLWIFKRKAKQQLYFFLYLLLVIGVDIIPVNFPCLIKFNRNILFVGYIIFSILYFGILYHQKIKNGFFRILILLIIITLIVLNVYKFNIKNIEQLDFISIISLPILLIFNSISWYWYKLRKADESKIIDDFLFWVSCGILIWSVFFIFRAIPMYFLQENDSQLLNFIINSFSVVNIITYLFFLIGLIFIKNERTS